MLIHTESGLVIRTGDRPGDLGTVAAMHGVLYAREHGMDQTIEAYVAGALGAFGTARAREGDRAGRLQAHRRQTRSPVGDRRRRATLRANALTGGSETSGERMGR